MKKFMLLLFDNVEMFKELSPEEMEQEIGEHMKWMEELGEHYDSGEPLLPEAKAIKGKDKIVTDGPFIESKELIGGFYIINAKDIDQAAELAKGCPVLKYGGNIEVREIMMM
mgnify:CR=1 FL=1